MFLSGKVIKMQSNFCIYLIALACFFSNKAMAEEYNLEDQEFYKEAVPSYKFVPNESNAKDDYLNNLDDKIDEEDVTKGQSEVDSSNLPDQFTGKEIKTAPKIYPSDSDFPSVLESEVRIGSNPHKRSSIISPGTAEGSSQIENISNSELMKDVAWKTKSITGFSYFAIDDFEYHDSTDLYNRVYKKGQKKRSTGLMLLSNSRYVAKGYLDLKLGVNLGIKYDSALGLFPDGTANTDSRFTLWSVPIDFSLGFDIPVSRYMKFSATAGPSAMILYQTRSDRGPKEDGKYRRQLGLGYFASAQALIGLSSIFPKYGFQLYADHGIGSAFLSLDARMVNYQNFQDEISIDGTSLGLGIMFEFL